MKKILVYISPERYSSLFDLILGYDSGADVVVPYSDTSGEDIRDVVYSCVYTRSQSERKNTAIFIGGPDVERGQEFMDEIMSIFNELPEEFRVSVAADPHGAHTTSSACVLKIKDAMGSLKGLNAVIIAGTGPVGQSTAVLLAKEGCEVSITSRKKKRASEVCRKIKRRYGVEVKPLQAVDDKTIDKAVSEADVVVTTGPEGVTLLPERIWSKHPEIKVLADVNAVQPLGIEGINPRDDLRRTADGRILIGPLPIGSLKIKIHRRLVACLFEDKGLVFDLDGIYKIAGELYKLYSSSR